MRRHCNLELGLLPSSSSASSVSSSSFIPMGQNGQNMLQQEEQMTIFYNGKICVCDVTEFQARSILWLASKRMQEGMSRSSMATGNDPVSSPTTLRSPQLYSPTGLSMKRSLQHFLEKRRNRIQASSPYHR